MKARNIALVTIAAIFAVLGAFTAAQSIPANPRYNTIADIDASNVQCDSVDVEWDASNHADFYKLRWSTHSNFDNAHSEFLNLRDRSVTINGLSSDDRLYFKVTVVDSEGHRLAKYSKVVSALTDEVC